MVKDSTAFVGLDLGDKRSNVFILDWEDELIEESRIPTTEPAFRHKFASLPPCRVAMEAGTHSRWASRLLEQLCSGVRSMPFPLSGCARWALGFAFQPYSARRNRLSGWTSRPCRLAAQEPPSLLSALHKHDVAPHNQGTPRNTVCGSSMSWAAGIGLPTRRSTLDGPAEAPIMARAGFGFEIG
jgi:hypothetical protein